MTSKCYCVPAETPLEIEKTDSKYAHVEVHFGKVPFNAKKTKEIELEIEEKVVDTFVVRKINEQQMHSNVFYVTPSSGIHRYGTKLKLKCTYVPNMPFVSNYEEFKVTGVHVSTTIAMWGESTGPLVTASTTHVTFLQEPRHKNGRAVIELRNHTDIPAAFTMEIDSKQKLFAVTPLQGVCSSVTFVVINFNPPDQFETYAQQLNCLFYGCQPIVINILGVYSKKALNPNTISVIYYPIQFEEKVGYKGCFRMENEDRRSLAPVTLSTHYLELGRAIVKELYDDKSTIATKNFNLTNNLENDVTINWIEEDKVFSIFPRKATVCPGECTFFKCFFNPMHAETCYNRMFTAQVYWTPHNLDTLPTNENVIVVPLTVSINLQGHSYREGQLPLGNLEFSPSEIEFPLSLSGENIYRNFKIINKLSRPVMFKLVAACLSHVIMTPMSGMITDFVVILANIRRLRDDKPLDESWHLVLNGQDQKNIKFRIIARTELPSIRIEDDNKVYFESIQIDTVATKSVMLHNTCDFNISFHFVQPDHHYLYVEPAQGTVQMHKKIPLTITFNASPCAPKTTNILIRMYVQQKVDEIVGLNFEHYFTVFTESTYSQLSATPLTDEFELVEYGTKIQTSFHLHNFGVSVVYFKINAVISQDKFKISPVMGQVEPKASLKMDLSLECKTLGRNLAFIEYYNRIDGTSEKHGKEAVPLLEFSYKCEMSILKIKEIVEHTFGPLFTKKHFWKFLKVDTINELFDSMLPEDTQALEIILPECPVGSRHYVTFLLENDTDLDTEITLKKLKLCNCGYKQVPCKYRIKYALDCIHRQTLFMEITQTKVDKRSSQKITIDVFYYLPGVNIMAYEIYIRPSRKLILYFNIFGIPENVSRISVYKNDLFLKMYSGVLSARSHQPHMFWFYNNSNIAAKIELNLCDVKQLNEANKFTIFECVYNDTLISPKGIWPLMVKFHPIELTRYQVTVQITINNETKVLWIEGFGTMRSQVNRFFDSSMPEASTQTHKFPIKFSKDVLMIKCLPIWNYAEQVIFIENLSKTRLVYYEWVDFYLENIIRITVHEKVGILRPGKSRSVKVLIESFNQTILASFVLACSVMDLQLLYNHKRMQALQEEMEKRKEEEFEFSHYPINYSNDKNGEDKAQMTLSSRCLNYVMTITVQVNVVDRKDLHLFVSDPSNMLKFNLPESLSVDPCRITADRAEEAYLAEEKKCSTDQPHEPKCQSMNADMVENVFEKIVSDVVFDTGFPQIVSTIFENHPPYYTQLKLDAEKLCDTDCCAEFLKKAKKLEVKKFFSRPTIPTLADTFRSFIEDSINGFFKLTPLEEQLKDEKAIKATMEQLEGLCTLKECGCASKKI